MKTEQIKQRNEAQGIYVLSEILKKFVQNSLPVELIEAVLVAGILQELIAHEVPECLQPMSKQVETARFRVLFPRI